MRRRQLIEIEDQPWCPRAIRDGGTDWLRFMAEKTGAFEGIVPKLRAAMDAVGTTRIVDMCSGGGGPWVTLSASLARTGPLSVTLSDLFPNETALAEAAKRSEGRVAVHPTPVDATDVPEALDGVRTMFNSFHHFPPEAARAILGDAVRKGRPIAIFEGMDRRLLPLLMMPLQPAFVWALTPFVRPFKWSRLALTYLAPAIPLLVAFDGSMSILRLYLADELRELVSEVPGHETFRWDIGTTPIAGAPTGLTHLVGVPAAS